MFPSLCQRVRIVIKHRVNSCRTCIVAFYILNISEISSPGENGKFASHVIENSSPWKFIECRGSRKNQEKSKCHRIIQSEYKRRRIEIDKSRDRVIVHKRNSNDQFASETLINQLCLLCSICTLNSSTLFPVKQITRLHLIQPIRLRYISFLFFLTRVRTSI